MSTKRINVNPTERTISALAGGALLIQGFFRRSFAGPVLAAPLLYRGISGHSFLYQALGINTTDANQQSSNNDAVVERSITIGKSAEELYRLWSNPDILAQVMGDFATVTSNGDLWHWQIQTPFGQQQLEWETRIVQSLPGQMLRWQSNEDAPISNEGTLRFQPAPDNRGTETTLLIRFDPPGGPLGNQVMKRLDIVPRGLAEKILRRFKSLVETGEIPTLVANSAARKDAIPK